MVFTMLGLGVYWWNRSPPALAMPSNVENVSTQTISNTKELLGSV